MGIVGDWNYLQGLKTNDPYYFKLANKLFPFDKNILTGEAEINLKNGVINLDTYRTLNFAFYYDPYSIRLFSIRMQYAFILGDNVTGTSDFNRLKIIAPSLPIIQQMVKINTKVDTKP